MDKIFVDEDFLARVEDMESADSMPPLRQKAAEDPELLETQLKGLTAARYRCLAG